MPLVRTGFDALVQVERRDHPGTRGRERKAGVLVLNLDGLVGGGAGGCVYVCMDGRGLSIQHHALNTYAHRSIDQVRTTHLAPLPSTGPSASSPRGRFWRPASAPAPATSDGLLVAAADERLGAPAAAVDGVVVVMSGPRLCCGKEGARM